MKTIADKLRTVRTLIIQAKAQRFSTDTLLHEALAALPDPEDVDPSSLAVERDKLKQQCAELAAKHKEALDMCERYIGHLHKAEQQNAELAAALRNVRDEKHRPSCGDIMEELGVAPGGHECSCPQAWATAALKPVEERK